ncbi:MAG: chloride channel protein [Acidimicrobiales bacterium]
MRARSEVAAWGRRTRQVVGFAAATGLVTGLGVAGFEWLTRFQMFNRLLRAPLPLQAIAPLCGLLLAAVALRVLARGAGRATTDEYIRNFHQIGTRLDPRPVRGRLVASVATLGFGGAMGYEGPSIYLGASLGSALQQRFSRYFSREDAKLLMVCGAAAGISAIFKAPATGLVFALEVPFQDGFAGRMVLPAGIASAVSYLAFVAITGTTPLFGVSGSPPFDLQDLVGAAVVGALCGIGARLFSVGLHLGRHHAKKLHPYVAAAIAGTVLAGLVVLSDHLFGRPLTLGAGYNSMGWALDPSRAVLLVLALLGLRTLATIFTVAGGGVGGLFIPLVIEGALLGRAIGGIFRPDTDSVLFPLLGASAFLGAGYRVPLSGVVFVAETTGRPGFIVPGLIATMVAQLFMGRTSVSDSQVQARAGHLQRRAALPLTSALRPDMPTVAPGTTLADFYEHHLLAHRELLVPVVDGPTYVGVILVDELKAVPRAEWGSVTVAERMKRDFPVAPVDWTLHDALAAMEAEDVDLLPVVHDGAFVGVVTTTAILELDEILRRTSDEE